MMTTQEVVEAVERERSRLIAAVDVTDANASVTDEGWTTKDVLAHCIHWLGMVASGMGARLEPPSYIIGVAGPSLSGDEWNARAVEHYSAWTFEEVRAEFDRNVDLLLEQVNTRSDDDMKANDSLPWAGDRPLWNKIGTETFLHWPAHADEIEARS